MIDTRIYLLGGMRVEQNGRFLSGIRSQKAFALLGYLAVEARPVARTTLAALFWGLEPEKKGRRELRRVLHNLTSLIPDCLDANRQTVQFGKNSNLWIDIRPFANLVNADDTNSLLQAVELYRGELMEGLYLDDCPQFETWLLGERERFRQQFIWGLGTLVAKYQSTGDFETALTYTQRLLSLDNWREETHQQMMLLLARTGQFSAALHQYKLCRRILFDELGVEPSAKTTLLYEQLKTAVSTPRHNLPAQAIPFVGRDKDLPTLQQTLMQPTCRLITITGLGGMGKTRLALKAAWQMDESNQVFFINGIWFVPLFKMVDQLSNTQDMSDQIALAITHALSLTFSSTRSPSDQLLNYLQDKELLLLLDNYEQLLPHTSLVQRILQETKHVKLLITSRECLNLQQETILQVNGLTTPPANYQFNSLADLQQYDSVRLFDSIARRVQPDFSLAAEGNDAANICRHLHGMPLALELTAVWVKTLSCKDVFAEIEMGMENLHKTQHNLPSRHHSIQTLFDTSWSRLSVKERQSVQKCAIFHGGFTYEAANHVAAADHATLAALVDKSLIRRTKAGRYEMHELLRQFEVSKLTEESDEPAKTRQQHGRYYTTFLCQREETMMGFNQLTTLAEIDADLPNILQTWGWVMASQDYDLIDKLIWPLVIYFELRNRYKEAYRLFYNAWQELIALPDVGVEKPALLACLSLHSSYFEMKLGRIDQARLALENTLPSIRQYGTQQNIGWALMALGESYWICGAYWRKMAESCFAEALAIFEKVSPIWLVGYTQTRLAQSIIWRLGQSNERAQHLLQNAHDVAVELENNWLHFYVEIISSRLWGEETQSNLYLSHLDKAIAAANQIGFKWGSGIATQKKANAAMKRVNRVLSKQTSNMAQYVARLLQHGLDSLPLGIDNEVKETAVAISHAIQYYEEVRQIFILIDDRLHADHALINLGEFCRHVGLFQRAIQYYERGIVSNKKHYDASFHAYCLMGLADIFLSVAELDSASAYFSQALSIFKSLEAREWDIAWSLNGLGDVAYAQGDYEQAQRYFKKSLEQFTKLDDDEGIALICQNLADTLHQMGDNERARMLYERSLPLCQNMNDEVGLGVYLFGMVKAKRAQQTAVWAATLLGAATNLLNANIGEPMPSFAQHEFDRYVATLQTEVDEAEFNTAWSNGQLLTVKAAITLAHK